MVKQRWKNTHIPLVVAAFLIFIQFIVFGNLNVVRKREILSVQRLEGEILLPEVQTSSQSATKHSKYHPTFLWGIPCVLGDYEQRKAVRETYLRYYKDNLQLKDQNDRICSLYDLQHGRVRFEDCQVAYFFFIGGNPNGPTELCETNPSMPILAPKRPPGLEQDVVALNIRENMEDGKSQTFLKYASLFIQNEFHFDYVVKVDSDALVFVPNFLKFLEERLQSPHTRVYGGIAQRSKPFGQRFNLTGGLYMQGSLYWMSADLADYVSSDQVDRKAITNFIPIEDVDIGNFVFSHPLNITTVEVPIERHMIHPAYNKDWKQEPRTLLLRDAFFAHSESCQNGKAPRPYFKDRTKFRKYWSIFQVLSASGSRTKARSLYALYEPKRQRPEEPFVRWNDYIYSDQDYDSSPIVIESHKLVFFTVSQVGDVTWRCLFRRMMGYPDWHNTDASLDGLRYLRDYNQTEASYIMTSPTYTRAIFVRDPKSRLVSIYQKEVSTEKGLAKIRGTCCLDTRDVQCNAKAKSLEGFLKRRFPEFCDEFSWRPQARKMEPRYFQTLTFVGHYERMQEDARRLLKQVGAWDYYGSSGWGPDGTEPIFSSVPMIPVEEELKSHLSDAELHELVEAIYADDYAKSMRSVFNFSRTN